MSTPDASQSSEQHFASLIAQCQESEGKLAFELDWQELPDAMASRVASWCPDASIEDETRWDEYLEWLSQRLVKMDQVLHSVVKALP